MFYIVRYEYIMLVDKDYMFKLTTKRGYPQGSDPTIMLGSAPLG